MSGQYSITNSFIAHVLECEQFGCVLNVVQVRARLLQFVRELCVLGVILVEHETRVTAQLAQILQCLEDVVALLGLTTLHVVFDLAFHLALHAGLGEVLVQS
jgi:ABC-type phosphonate transport system ATPase subunit